MRTSRLRAVLLAPLAALALHGCGNKAESGTTSATSAAGLGGAQGVKQLMQARA